MNTTLLKALKQIVAEYGVQTLADSRRVKALLADLAAGEPKPQKNALIACLDQGFPALLQNVAARERGSAKATLAERLNREEGLDLALCGDTLDLLEAALFGKGRQEQMKVLCRNCGKELQVKWNACPYCGAPSAVPVPAAPIQPEPPPVEKITVQTPAPQPVNIPVGKRRKALSIFAASVIIGGLVIAGWYVYDVAVASGAARTVDHSAPQTAPQAASAEPAAAHQEAPAKPAVAAPAVSAKPVAAPQAAPAKPAVAAPAVSAKPVAVPQTTAPAKPTAVAPADVDTRTDFDLSGYWNNTDVTIVCDSLIASLLQSPRMVDFIARKGYLPIILVGSFRNESAEYINTSTISTIMEQAIFESGKALPVAGGISRGNQAEQQSYASEASAAALANEVGADFLLTGTVRTIEDRAGNTATRTYFVSAELINIETNSRFWMGQNNEIKKVIEPEKN